MQKPRDVLLQAPVLVFSVDVCGCRVGLLEFGEYIYILVSVILGVFDAVLKFVDNS